MINTKVNVVKNMNEVRKVLEDRKLQEHLVGLFYEGMDNLKKAQELDKGLDINSYSNASGIQKAKKIGDVICNNKQGSKFGIKSDVKFACNIPTIRISNIFMTIKSLKNPNNILKSRTGYIREFSKINDKLNCQTNLFSLISEEPKININAKYYGIITYNILNPNCLQYMNFVFLSETMSSILLNIKVPQDILNRQGKITHKDDKTITKDNIKNEKSLKKLLKIK